MTHVTASRVSLLSSPIRVPGPLDRASFFAEQQRNRRATWRLFTACVSAILLMGIPLCLVITPLVCAVILFCVHTVDLIIPQPGLLAALGAVGQVALFGLVYVMELFGEASSQDIPAHPYLGFGLFLLPGIVVIGSMWWGVHLLFMKSGVEGVLLRLGARTPRSADLEEQQLVNLVEEMALAAGLPAPRVTLIDSSVTNAAVMGTSAADATLVLSRCLLDEFDRSETQAVIGHLMGSVGNGDLRIAFTILSVFLTFAFLVNVLSSPFSPQSRTMLRQLMHLGVHPKTRQLDKQTETALIQLLLMQGLGFDDKDGFDHALETPMGKVLLPVIFSALSVKMTLFVFISFLLGPLIALLWRTRRYLADATAVQLTRDPDSLARALTGLAVKGGMIPGAQAIAHLFIISREAVQEQKQAAFQQVVKAAQKDGYGQLPAEDAARIRTALQERLQASTTTTKGTLAESLGTGSFVSFHPPIPRRLERLQKLGATVAKWQPTSLWERWGSNAWKGIWTLGPGKGIIMCCLLALLVVLVPIAIAGLFLVVAMFTMVNLMFMEFLLFGIHGIFIVLTFLKAWALSYV